LLAGFSYSYRVQSFNAGGGSYSGEANATTSVFFPAATVRLSASPVSSSQFNLSWTGQSTKEMGI